MRPASKRFLVDLLSAPGPSGYEGPVRAVWKDAVKKYADRVEVDVHGNTIGCHNEAGGPKIMFAGHADELGFQIVYIDDKGYLYFDTIGGFDLQIVPGRKVRIHTAQGPVLGVLGKKPIHLMKAADRTKVPDKHDLWIDIGAADKEEAEQLVAIGDPATYDANFEELRNGLVVSRGIDNKAGAWVVAEALRRVSRAKRKCRAAVYAVATVQEEVGLRGAKTSAYGVDPLVGIAVDVTWATDHPDIDKRQVGECKLGGGPVILRGANANPVVYERLVQVAEKKKIPYQIQAEPGGYRYGRQRHPAQSGRGGHRLGQCAAALHAHAGRDRVLGRLGPHRTTIGGVCADRRWKDEFYPMKITTVDIWTVVVPTIPGRVHSPEWVAETGWDQVPKHIVRLNTDTELVGLGETGRGMPIEQVREGAGRLLGKDPERLTLQDIFADRHDGTEELPTVGAGPAYDAFEMAIFDLVGKARQVPVHALLGGAVRDRVRADYWMGHLTPEDGKRAVERALAHGFKGVKIKCKIEEPMVERLEAMREVGGVDFKVTVDPNERFHTAEQTIELAQQLEAVGNVEVFEDPDPKVGLGRLYPDPRGDQPAGGHARGEWAADYPRYQGRGRRLPEFGWQPRGISEERGCRGGGRSALLARVGQRFGNCRYRVRPRGRGRAQLHDGFGFCRELDPGGRPDRRADPVCRWVRAHAHAAGLGLCVGREGVDALRSGQRNRLLNGAIYLPLCASGTARRT